MANQVPIVGEGFKPYVNDQITARQKIYGSGFSSNRTPQQMTYLNSSTPWVKLASSVSILDIDDGKNRLKDLGLGEGYEKGVALAKQAVLFNGLTPFDGGMRSGVAQSKSLINSSVYGFGGTEFGLKPLPGIISMDVTPVNRGSIKQANVNIKAYNKFQFELIETLYLRLGYTIMLEWGNSIYVNNENEVQKMGSTLIDSFFFKNSGLSHLEVLKRIESERQDKKGNYDGLFAKVVNFDWTYQPDGSYDITLKLTSLGDVVESFKVNILTPSTQLKETPGFESNSDDLADDKVNKNTASNFLNVIKSKYTDDDFQKPESGVIQINEFTPEEEQSLAQQFVSTFSSTTPIDSRFYIRLGTLLEYIQREVLINIDNQNGCFPLFFVNTSEGCVMKSKPKLISIEPQTCIIRPNFNKMGIEPPEWATVMKEFFTKKGKGNIGFIHDIYLNFSFIEKTLDSNIDKDGNLSFYSFVTALLNGINRSLSNICDLEVTINEENNEVIIRDQKLPSRTNKDGKLADGKKVSKMIEVTGFNNSESNFVKNFSFKTQITSKLATMLTIGATADNKSVNEDATAFSKWNSGLMDRFNQSMTDGTPDKCSVKDTETNPESGKPIKKTLSWETIWEIAKENLYIGTTLALGKSIETAQNSIDRNNEFEKLKKQQNNSLDTYLQACFAEKFKVIKGGEAQAYTRNDGNNPNAVLTSEDGTERQFKTETFNGKKYFQNDPDFIEKGKNILKNYIKTEDIAKAKKTNKPSSNIGFIPIDLSLDIRGMSGLKIYNQLKLNTDFLPYNYPSTMEFVVMGLSHKVDSSGWSTSISAIGKPQSE